MTALRKRLQELPFAQPMTFAEIEAVVGTQPPGTLGIELDRAGIKRYSLDKQFAEHAPVYFRGALPKNYKWPKRARAAPIEALPEGRG